MVDKIEFKENKQITNFVECIEGILFKKLPPLLSKKFTDKEILILLTPWVKNISNILVGFLSKNEEIVYSSNLDYKYTPGDTLHFLVFSRSPEFIDYLNNKKNINFEVEKRTEILKLPMFIFSKYLFFNTGIPKTFLYILTFKYFFKIKKLKNKKKKIKFPIDEKRRFDIYLILNEEFKNKHSTWLAKKIVEMLPRSLLEGLDFQHELYSKKLYYFEYLFSSDSWSSLDYLKIFAFTQQKKRKLKLIGAPHSLSYSTLKNFWLREYEISFLDKYLLWGKLNLLNSYKCYPFYSNKFLGNKNDIPFIVSNNLPIILTSAARPTHTIEFPYTVELFEKYLTNQIELIKCINEKTKKEVVLRSREKNRGDNITKFLNKNDLNIKIDFQSGNFKSELTKYSLHICDNPSTTIIESLVMNFPTLIYFENDYFLLTDKAFHSFNAMSKVGIFHTNRHSLINQINLIRSNINNWWNTFSVQNSVDEFLKDHANSLNSVDSWIRDFEAIMKK
jgi:putative transferase (TIGR04331 family)